VSKTRPHKTSALYGIRRRWTRA